MNWSSASNEARTLLALGTHDLSASLVEYTSSKSAVVLFTANSTTLGSMVRGIDATDFWNSLPVDSGPFSKIDQQLTWREELSW